MTSVDGDYRRARPQNRENARASLNAGNTREKAVPVLTSAVT